MLAAVLVLSASVPLVAPPTPGPPYLDSSVRASVRAGSFDFRFRCEPAGRTVRYTVRLAPTRGGDGLAEVAFSVPGHEGVATATAASWEAEYPAGTVLVERRVRVTLRTADGQTRLGGGVVSVYVPKEK